MGKLISGLIYMGLGAAVSNLVFEQSRNKQEEEMNKREELIKRLRYIYRENQGIIDTTPQKTLSEINSDKEIINRVKYQNEEPIIFPYFYHLYKDAVFSSVSGFFTWLDSSEELSKDSYNYIKSVLI